MIPRRALILVDIQNDFMPFGALPVARGDEVVEVANRLMGTVDLVVATQDWHPGDHGSFASNHPGHAPGDVVELGGVPQVLWPDHCVQGSPGASFHSALEVARIDVVVRKGTDPAIDSYSGFFDNGHRKDTGMSALLHDHGVRDITLVGLATDYCVKYTALDAAEAGYIVTVVEDGVRAVDLNAGDGEAALQQMREAGCTVVRCAELLQD
jgi:nicotinamidase/pyrazinamidase